MCACLFLWASFVGKDITKAPAPDTINSRFVQVKIKSKYFLNFYFRGSVNKYKLSF